MRERESCMCVREGMMDLALEPSGAASLVVADAWSWSIPRSRLLDLHTNRPLL